MAPNGSAVATCSIPPHCLHSGDVTQEIDDLKRGPTNHDARGDGHDPGRDDPSGDAPPHRRQALRGANAQDGRGK